MSNQEQLTSDQRVIVEGSCVECGCAYSYTVDPNDPVHWKLCDECIEKGVIEP